MFAPVEHVLKCVCVCVFGGGGGGECVAGNYSCPVLPLQVVGKETGDHVVTHSPSKICS
jgi:hypothetical protein